MLSEETMKQGDLNAFIDQGAEFSGELRYEHTVRIDGRFKGKIVTENELIVGEEADVDAEIHVGTITVSGRVRGSIFAKHSIKITAKGRVYSHIETPRLEIAEGGFFQGSCSMDGDQLSEDEPVPEETVPIERAEVSRETYP